MRLEEIGLDGIRWGRFKTQQFQRGPARERLQLITTSSPTNAPPLTLIVVLIEVVVAVAWLACFRLHPGRVFAPTRRSSGHSPGATSRLAVFLLGHFGPPETVLHKQLRIICRDYVSLRAIRTWLLAKTLS